MFILLTHMRLRMLFSFISHLLKYILWCKVKTEFHKFLMVESISNLSISHICPPEQWNKWKCNKWKWRQYFQLAFPIWPIFKNGLYSSHRFSHLTSPLTQVLLIHKILKTRIIRWKRKKILWSLKTFRQKPWETVLRSQAQNK